MPGPDDVEIRSRELDMAKQLVESLATDFDPDRYEDSYRLRVLELIERKAAGQEVVTQPTVEQPARVVDLMSALEESLDVAKDRNRQKKRAS